MKQQKNIRKICYVNSNKKKKTNSIRILILTYILITLFLMVVFKQTFIVYNKLINFMYFEREPQITFLTFFEIPESKLEFDGEIKHDNEFFSINVFCVFIEDVFGTCIV